MARPVSSAATSVAVRHLVIGGGVVGLAVAARLAQRATAAALRPTTGGQLDVLLVEKNRWLAEEASARNSEVIHAGLYHPAASLKTRLCVRGARMLYAMCERLQLPHSHCGKWIVAANEEQAQQLHAMKARVESAAAADDEPAPPPLAFLTQQRASQLEPWVRPAAAILHSSRTGIVDSHAVVCALEHQCTDGAPNVDSLIMRRTRVTAIHHDGRVFHVRLETTALDGVVVDVQHVTARTVTNCGGLWADEVVAMLLPPQSVPRIHPCRGTYYRLSRPLVSRLVYPAPVAGSHAAGLGVHLTIDLAGRVRVGPDAAYCHSKSDYRVHEGSEEEQRQQRHFLAALGRLLRLPVDEPAALLSVDYCGLRAKLSSPDQPEFRDFIIRDEASSGYAGFINLLGIESPGLTACLAIAEHVVDDLLQPYH